MTKTIIRIMTSMTVFWSKNNWLFFLLFLSNLVAGWQTYNNEIFEWKILSQLLIVLETRNTSKIYTNHNSQLSQTSVFRCDSKHGLKPSILIHKQHVNQTYYYQSCFQMDWHHRNKTPNKTKFLVSFESS